MIVFYCDGCNRKFKSDEEALACLAEAKAVNRADLLCAVCLPKAASYWQALDEAWALVQRDWTARVKNLRSRHFQIRSVRKGKGA